jgi:hypothetical protein
MQRCGHHSTHTLVHGHRDAQVVLCTIDTLHNKVVKELRHDASDRLHTIYIDEASLVPEEAMSIIGLFNPVRGCGWVYGQWVGIWAMGVDVCVACS